MSLKKGLACLYLVVCMALTFGGVAWSPFTEDESQWIYTSRYLTLFSRGMFSSPEWDTYWTETQPPLARYIMGASLKAGGYNLLQLNTPWDFTMERVENEAAGNMPTPGMLAWARLPMGIAAAASVLVLFLIGSRVGGMPAGLAAAGWLTLNFRARNLMTRAEGDGLLIFFVLLSLLVTLVLVKRLHEKAGVRYALMGGAVLGVILGLGLASKLTAAIAIAAVPASLVAVYIVRWLSKRKVSWREVGTGAGIAASAALLAWLVSVALNPAVYSAPVAGTLDLFENRQIEMAQQMQDYPTGALDQGWPRIWAGIRRPLLTYGVVGSVAAQVGGGEARTLGETLPLDAVLAALGIMTALGMVIMSMRARNKGEERDGPPFDQPNRAEPALIALVWTLVFYVAIVINMGLDWDRYTLPLMVFAALWAGTGIGWLLERIAALVARKPTDAHKEIAVQS